MALEIMREDVRIIQGLSDYPNQEEGLSAAEMREKFDEAAVRLQDFINNSVVPAVNDKLSGTELSGAVAKAVEDALSGITPDKIGAAPAVESESYPGCYYRTVSGTVEWLNPPMVLGVEYKTVERYLGKSVYVKTVSIGNLPNKSIKQVRYTGSGESTTNILNVRVVATNETGRPQPLPLDYNGLLIEVHANAEFVYVRTIDDNSEWTAVAVLKYTKD